MYKHQSVAPVAQPKPVRKYIQLVRKYIQVRNQVRTFILE